MERYLSAGLGTIKGNEISKNRDSDTPSRLISTEISSLEDVQTVELAIPSGEDFTPENEDVVLIIPISKAYKLGLIVDDQIAPDGSIKSGEKEIYSKVAGTRLATIRLNKDSEIILNSGNDFAVSFNELKSQVDKLRADLIAHVHPGVTAGAVSTGASITPFTVNVDGTKVDKVRI